MPLLASPSAFDDSSGVWAAIAVIVASSMCTFECGRVMRTMVGMCAERGLAMIGSAVRISVGTSTIGGPMAPVAEIVDTTRGRPSALAAAAAIKVRWSRRLRL